MALIRKCDKCGSEVVHTLYHIYAVDIEDILGDELASKLDLCENCVSKIMSLANRKNEEPGA